jgi:UDP-N-acetylglucosamine:LPS N-acetylglucosamine transferase
MLLRETALLGQHMRIHKSGPGFLKHLVAADVAIVGAGTTSAEVAFLGVPAIFIPVAENQSENILAIERAGLGFVVAPENGGFEGHLVKALLELLDPGIARDYSMRGRKLVDGHGVSRVARILTG